MTATIEDVKEYWNRQPCNVKHSKKEIGTREYFEEVEKKIDQQFLIEMPMDGLQFQKKLNFQTISKTEI